MTAKTEKMEINKDQKKSIENINTNLHDFTVNYKIKDSERENRILCTFRELQNNSIDNIIPDSLQMSKEQEESLENLKVDLNTYWNTQNKELFKLDYRCEYQDLPYYIKLPFNSDLINEINLIKTHNKDGKFISKQLKNKDSDLHELDRKQLYGLKNEDHWEIVTLKDIDNRFEKYREERSYISYPKGFGRKYSYLVLFFWLILSPISIFLPSSPIINLFTYTVAFYISPPGIQFVQINTLIRSIKIEIRILINCFIRTQYERDISFKLYLDK